jgi:hypothetical protein
MDLKRGKSIAVTNPRVMRGIGDQPLVYMCSLEVFQKYTVAVDSYDLISKWWCDKSETCKNTSRNSPY